MRKFTLAVLALSLAGLLAACGSTGTIDPYPEDCITPGAPCEAGPN